MSGFHRVINYIGEDLDDQTQIDMSTLDQVAVLIVGFAIRHEFPQAIPHLALNYHISSVRLRFVPYMFGNALNELQMSQISIKAPCWVLIFRLLGQDSDRSLMVEKEQVKELCELIYVEPVASTTRSAKSLLTLLC